MTEQTTTPRQAGRISVVIPVFNEAPNVPEMCRRLTRALEPISTDHEIIFVDDASPDGTAAIVQEQRALDPRVKLVSLSRRFGHQPSVMAGLDYATGDAVIMMDGDLQHSPELVPELVARWQEGYDVVSAIRLTTVDEGWLTRASSRWFYACFNWLSGLDLEPGSADFRLLDREAVEALQQLPERARFIRGLVQWIGFSHAQIRYHAASRAAGVSKYTFGRKAGLALVAAVSFSAKPLYLLAAVGFALATVSFLYGIIAIVMSVTFKIPVPGWTSILSGIMFIGGVQMLSLGAVGVYVAKIYEEVKGRPPYFVRRAYGFQTESSRRGARTDGSLRTVADFTLRTEDRWDSRLRP